MNMNHGATGASPVQAWRRRSDAQPMWSGTPARLPLTLQQKYPANHTHHGDTEKAFCLDTGEEGICAGAPSLARPKPWGSRPLLSAG
jgi:hypothetical protein